MKGGTRVVTSSTLAKEPILKYITNGQYRIYWLHFLFQSLHKKNLFLQPPSHTENRLFVNSVISHKVRFRFPRSKYDFLWVKKKLEFALLYGLFIDDPVFLRGAAKSMVQKQLWLQTLFFAARHICLGPSSALLLKITTFLFILMDGRHERRVKHDCQKSLEYKKLH